MEFKVQLKQAGKKENKIVTAKLVLKDKPNTIKELIEFTVKATLNAYNDKLKKSASFAAGELSDIIIFSEDQMEEMAASGKIGFDFLKNNSSVSEKEAVETALQSFEDGIVAVFIEGQRYENFVEKIELTGNETLTFVKLTMLAGRMW